MNEVQILVLDFGSQYTQLIARRLRELGVYTEIVPYFEKIEKIKAKKAKGIILSGGPASVYEEGAYKPEEKIFELKIPILGICYGMQYIAHYFGAKVIRANKQEFGKAKLELIQNENALLNGIKQESIVWMSHADKVEELPQDFVELARSGNTHYCAIANISKQIYALQFHPEVVHSEYGKEILKNFAVQICGANTDWNMKNFIHYEIEKIRQITSYSNFKECEDSSIQTNRLILRKYTEQDLQDLHKILSDKETMYAWQKGFTLEESKQWLDKQIAKYRKNGFAVLAIIEKESNKLIGYVGLNKELISIDNKEQREIIELAYLLDKKYWGKNLASEAVQAMQEYAFKKLKIKELLALIKDDNERSIKLAKKFKAKEIGSCIKAGFKHKVFEFPNTVKNSKVLCAVSGGVDSSVVATLLYRAIKDNLIPIFVDTGLLRKGEREAVEKMFKENLKVPLITIDASEEFLGLLKGVKEPELKRKIIGETFIKVFEREAKKHDVNGEIEFLAQGTLYPDVIESVSVKGPSKTIKSHHNVGGLPQWMKFKLIEPLRELFKDEVRALGKELEMPDSMLMRHPFPGPGLAIRIMGEVNRQDLDLLKEADSIFIEELHKWKLYNSVWQAFCVLLNVKSVGVMGDNRTYDNTICLRAVEAIDGMTANFSHLPHEFLESVSNRIINEVKGVNRVVYDITSKPPGTIEWE